MTLYEAAGIPPRVLNFGAGEAATVSKVLLFLQAEDGMRDPVVTGVQTCALPILCFSVDPGELFGLLGPNGAGKTTMIKILTTLLLPTSGSARVLALAPATQHRELRRRIGYVFGGDRGLYERISGLDNLR